MKAACTVDGCPKPQYAHGWCNPHYMRVRRTGSLVLRDKPTREERFWAKVDFLGESASSWDGSPLPGVCWNWMSRQRGGSYGKYGRFQFSPRKPVAAHRFAYELIVGPIPAGLTIDHLCRNPLCVNPQHLEPVTADENTRRREISRQNQKETA